MTKSCDSHHGLCIEILDGKNALDALEPEWTELCGRAAEHHCSQTIYWARHAWTYVSRHGGCRLRVVVGREQGRLVLVWPLVIRNHLAWRQADWLGSGNEYRDVLVDRDLAHSEWIDAAWRVITGRLGVDLVRCPAIRPEAAVASLLRQQAAAAVWQAPALYIPIDQWPDWQTASRGMNSKLRRELRRRRRRLSERGHVIFRALDDLAQVERAVSWLIAQKRAWAQRKTMRIGRLQSSAYEHFLTGVARDALRVGHLLLGVLELDGKILAAQLSFVAGSRMELYMISYDREWKSYGPGLLLLNEMIALSFEEQLRTVDFRTGLEAFKHNFLSEQTGTNEYIVPCSRWGACYVVWRRSPLRAAIKSGYRALPTAVQGALKSR